MKPIRQPMTAREEAIEATAAAWLARLDEGLTAKDACAFELWRDADPAHQQAIHRLSAAWTALLPLRSYRPEARIHPDPDLLRAPPLPRRLTPWLVMGGLAAAAVIAISQFPQPPVPVAATSVHRQHYTSPINGYERMILADGSLLELNADSAVSVAFTSTARQVRLVQGEAHFTVSKDAQRPFVVEAGAISVRAVGTAFNVRLDPDQIEVLVTEGSVQVGASATPSAAGRKDEVFGESSRFDGPIRIESPLLVVAGQRALLSGETTTPVTSVQAITAEAIREALAWQSSRLVFAGTPLNEVVAQFNRRNAIKIEIADPSLADLPIGGSFRPENVDAFVRLLTSDREIIAERPSAQRIVLRRTGQP